MSDAAEEIEVIQSAESTTRYSCTIQGIDVGLNFISAAKGRMDFSVAMDGVPHGKANLLSQHSIARILKSANTPETIRGKVETQFLIVGEQLRDGNFTPAPVTEAKTFSYEGLPSSLGAIDADVVEEFLAMPDLLDRVNEILHESRLIPFKGDDAGLIMNFLVILSCKTGTPLNLELIGPSASGKTHLALTARNGFPKSMVMVLAGASREALKYDYDEVDDDGNYLVHVDGKCIVVLEKDESSQFIQRLKPLMSGDDAELVFKTPIKNEVTGEIETRDFKIIGQPSFVTLTTRNPKEWEQVTRQLLMTPDSSPEKVKGVVTGILDAKARPEDLSIHEDLNLMQASMAALPKREVRNIFAPLLAPFFPSSNASHQRNVTKVIGIIDAITLLHHQQRPTQKMGDRQFVMSTVEDNVVGLILADKVLRASLSGVPDDTWGIFTHLVKMEETGKALTEDNILQYLHIQRVQMSRRALRDKHIETLTETGLLEVARRGGGRGGAKKSYRTVRTQRHFMEQYALTPLFIDAVSSNLNKTLSEFGVVLDDCDPPMFPRKPSRSERAKIDNMVAKGASSDLKRVIASMVLPQYTRRAKKGNAVWEIIGPIPTRKHLFANKTAWMPGSKSTGATKEHEKRKKGIKAAQESLEQISEVEDVADEDLWTSMITGQFEGTDTGPTRKIKRKRRSTKSNDPDDATE